MIYTITFNPAIDYIINSKKVDIDSVNKIDSKVLVPGGKGINASILLNELEVENKAIFFSSGWTGDLFTSMIKAKSIDFKKFDSGFYTRINVKVNTDDHNFELNGRKEEIYEKSVDELFDYIRQNVSSDDYVLIMGSFPSDLIVSNLIDIVNSIDAKLVLDIESENILSIIENKKVFFMKPNEFEILNFFEKNEKISSEDKIKNAMKKLVDSNVENIMVSLGAEGSVFMNKDNYIKINPAKIDLVNPVGAGDSTVAGFIYSMFSNYNINDALIFANACGGATASSKCIASKSKVLEVLEKVKKAN